MSADWESSTRTPLAKYVADTVARHLSTYEQDRMRLVEDRRHETSVLEAGYRHRQVIELVQNGADALRETPGGGRIEVILGPDTMYVANEGSPLTEAGLTGLLYIGLSEKTGKEIGRLGVGFKSVLEVTSSPKFLSRSISLSFDSRHSRDAIEAVVGPVAEGVPIMRIAEVIDPHSIAAEDHVVVEMMAWASSIVVLPLDRDGSDWLSETLSAEQLPQEFLLFSPHVSELAIEDHRTGKSRRISCERDAETLLLRDSAATPTDEPTSWQVRTQTVLLSERARTDGGERFGRESVDLAWAIPQATKSTNKYRELWAFFPIPGVGSSLPGILNTAWRLSDDRGNLVDGHLNRELLSAAADLALTHLTDHAPATLPGFALDLLPSPPVSWDQRPEGGWAAPLLRELIWESAPKAKIVPAESGSWHVGSDLRLWPRWANKSELKEVVGRWREAVGHPDSWVHRSVMTEARIPRAQHLNVSQASARDWIEAIRSDEHAISSSLNALELTAELLRHSATQSDHEELISSLIVRTRSDSWTSIADARLDYGAPDTHTPVDEIRYIVRALHEQLDISDSVEERSLIGLARAPMNPESAKTFWTLVHEIGAGRAEEVLAGLPSLDDVLVRTVSGKFARANRVLLPGRIVSADDAAVAVDLAFHHGDEALLKRAGIREVPDRRLATGEVYCQDNFFDGYAQVHELEWRSLQQHHSGSTPHSGRAAFRPTVGDPWRPTMIGVIGTLAEPARRRWTDWAFADESWKTPWVVQHDTQSKYKPLEIPSPLAWAIRQIGVINTSNGPAPTTIAVSPELSRWREYLAVAEELTQDSAVALGLASTLEMLDERAAAEAITRAAAKADTTLTVAPVAFLRALADAGWQPGREFGSALISERPNEVREARESGTRAWLCPPQYLHDWPTGWPLTELERLPALGTGDIESFALAEMFPTVAEKLSDATVLTVWLCDTVLLHGHSVSFGRDGSLLLIARATDHADRLQWVAEELLGSLDPSERSQIVNAGYQALDARLSKALGAAKTDSERLVALLTPEQLAQAVVELLPERDYGPPEAQAAALLATFGPSTLRQVRHLLPTNLGVPSKWAGGELVLQFVRRMGFADEFAGRRRAERPGEERVLGPVVAGNLHPFQEEIAEQVKSLLSRRGCGVIDLPTGAGKTRVAIEAILQHAVSESRLGTVVWIAERDELCEQAVTQWLQLWRAKGLPDEELRVSRFWGGGSIDRSPDLGPQVVVTSRQQLHRRLTDPKISWLREADLLVIDEAHHSTADTYIQIRKWFGGEELKPLATLGLSATPFRSDAERTDHLARIFDRSLVSGDMMGRTWRERISWLQEQGYLSRIKPSDLGRGEVKPTDEEARRFVSDPNLSTGLDLLNQRLGDDETRNQQIVTTISNLEPDWPIVVFAGSVTHAQRLAVSLSERGISSRPVWGALTPWARRDAIEAFRAGRIRVLTNFGVLSEGFDAPKTRAVIIARLVQSDGLFLQMLGRGMRGPKNGGTEVCDLITTGERLPNRFDKDGQLDINRYDYLWNPR